MHPLHLRWALRSSGHMSLLFPGTASWCHPGCKQQLGSTVPRQVLNPTLLQPQGVRGQPGP